ncbi:MAG: ATP-binding protein [Bacteroidales bacterium]
MFFSTRKDGSGLGLSISREIIRMHRGKLLVSSRQGAGTSFMVLL